MKSSLLRWHRRIGLAAAVLVAVLALSGVALNHTRQFELDQRRLTAPWLMQWYGLTPEAKLRAYEAGGHWLLAMEGGLFLDSDMLPHGVQKMAGAVAKDGNLIAAGEKEILLLAEDGALIERITALPATVKKIGVTPDGKVAIADQQNHIFISGDALLEWRPADMAGIVWSTPSAPPNHVQEQYFISYRGAGLNLERIVLDVHSGRILGAWGPWLMDGAAILLLLLAATGIAGWLRARNANGDANAP